MNWIKNLVMLSPEERTKLKEIKQKAYFTKCQELAKTEGELSATGGK
jgi:hypothetical protein